MMIQTSNRMEHLSELTRKLQPAYTSDARERARAWDEWLSAGGAEPVRKFIRWSNATAAEDDEILQETLLLAYQKVERGQYQDRSLPFTAFLKKIAHYKILEAARTSRRQIALDMIDHLAASVEIGADESAFEQVDRWMEYDQMRRALDQLSPRRRRIILMYETGYTTAEIAAQCRIHRDLVRKEKSLALRHLRALLSLMRELELERVC